MSQVAKKIRKFNTAPLCMCGMLGVAGLSQVRLQVFEQGSTIAEADNVRKYFVTKTDRAGRGTIFSSDGKPLAQDTKAWRLQVNLSKVPHTPAFAVAMSEATGIPAHEFLDESKGGRDWPMRLSEAQFLAVSRVKKDFDAAGVSLIELAAREYPLGVNASGIVGRLVVRGKDDELVDRFGLEAQLDKTLKGVDGKQTGLQDKNGEFLPLRSFDPVSVREDGAKVVTTIDSEIQTAASMSVRRAVERNHADHGVAVVVAPDSGDVLAVASWPVVDPATQGLNKLDAQNPAYTMVFEPGSTFKILTLAKAISDGVVSEGQITECAGVWNLGKGMRVRCDEHHGNRAHGAIGPGTAIAKSCNVAAAQWASRVGYEGFFDFLGELGLRTKTDLQLTGEIRSRGDKQEWGHSLQLANLGFGQAMAVTPIGLAGAFATLGNGGIRKPLRLVRAVDGELASEKPGEQVLSKEACDFALECMEQVMAPGGTGASLRIPGYRLGGKTGTAQKYKGGKSLGYVSNFVGMIPARAPKAVVLVMVDNPKGGKFYGADVAGPVFMDVAKSVIRRLNVPAEN